MKKLIKKTKIRAPKEPRKFNWPRLYMAVDIDTGEVDEALRIVYPSGRGDWVIPIYNKEQDYACWAAVNRNDELSYSSSGVHRPKLAFQSRQNMIKYLKEFKNLKPIFIGEIK